MVKKKISLVLIVLVSINLYGQSTVNGKPLEIKYRRSSLHTILMESESFPYKDTVIKAYNNAPFPDKYNNHSIGEKSFNPKLYSAADIKNDEDYKAVIDSYFVKNRIADKLVAKWFNRKDDGTFDMDLIGERGAYNASEMAAKIASNSARGLSSLSDAGEELIGNTFVVVSKLNFVSNEVPAAAAKMIADAAADQLPDILRIAAKQAAYVAYMKARDGYSVWTTSFLYKLRWNDSIAAVFYNDMWMDKSNISKEKKEKFNNTDIFGMDFVGSEKSSCLVLFSKNLSADKIVEEATVRSVDAVYVKLQKKYDVFKTKTPLYTGYPITAKIGLKEGLEAGDKYEVLEQVLGDDGKTKYERKGVIKVDKKQIWDNRFYAGDSVVNQSVVNDKEKVDRTLFKGGKDFYAGMLIRQIK